MTVLHAYTVMAGIILAGGVLQAQERKTAIAVNDFRGEGVEESSARIITDRIRSELVAGRHFRVIERTEMDNILREQGFQKSGACDDENCLVEVGQLLGVNRMVAGTIGKLGDLYTITLRMIDVASGEIVATVNEDCRCAIEDIPSRAVPSVVRKLTAAMTSPSAAETAAAAGIIRVASQPPGARLSIDGAAVGNTPYENTAAPAGLHTLRLELDGYQTKDEAVLIDPSKPLQLAYTLAPLKSVPGKHRNGRIIRRIVFGAGTVACAAAGYRLDRRAKSEYDVYSALPPATPEEKFNTAWGNVVKYQRFRNAAYILSGAGAIGFTLSFIF